MKLHGIGRFSFPGGVHPPEKKALTCDGRLQPGPAVTEAAVMLSQHLGAVCKPLVRKAEAVQAGQKIGDYDAFVSAPVRYKYYSHITPSAAVI
ncbi:hypothetical protein ACFL5Z_01325 [Planctomycetota bacterium]